MEVHLIQQVIQRALEEDLAWGDITSDNLIDPKATCELVLTLKEEGVIAGIPVAERTFKTLDPGLSWLARKKDGEFLPAGTTLVKLKGNACQLMKAERVALNFLQRMSGIATLTSKFVKLAHEANPKVRIADTRKTTPGLRYFEKYAVKQGGGHNHRYCLADAVMIKDNHVALLRQEKKTLKAAIALAREKVSHTVKIEVEVDRLEEIEPAVEAGADCILLDNMTIEQLIEGVAIINGRTIVEASGGVNLATVADIARTGVDLISVGALTHSPNALDISLDYA